MATGSAKSKKPKTPLQEAIDTYIAVSAAELALGQLEDRLNRKVIALDPEDAAAYVKATTVHDARHAANLERLEKMRTERDAKAAEEAAEYQAIKDTV